MTHEYSGTDRIYPNPYHELSFILHWRNQLKTRGGVFIDVGACVGNYTIGLADLFDKVYAVEPYYTEQLRLNIQDHHLNNVVVIDAAAWDFNGSLTAGIIQPTNMMAVRVGVPGKVVKTIKLDDVAEPFRFLKIDVEGVGLNVLRGMTRLLENSSGHIQIEVHDHAESHGTYLFLKDYGWRHVGTYNERHGNDWYHAYKVYTK